MASMNPFDYKPSQIAKAIVAALTAAVGLCGWAASNLTEGPLATVGGWATAASLVLIPILVFAKKAAPWAGMLDGRLPVDEG